MKSELAKNLKEVLENMTQEQFDKEWGEVVQMGFEGVSFRNYLEVQELLYNANQFGIAFSENINNKGMTKIECYIAGFVDGAKRYNLP